MKYELDDGEKEERSERQIVQLTSEITRSCNNPRWRRMFCVWSPVAPLMPQPVTTDQHFFSFRCGGHDVRSGASGQPTLVAEGSRGSSVCSGHPWATGASLLSLPNPHLPGLRAQIWWGRLGPWSFDTPTYSPSYALGLSILRIAFPFIGCWTHLSNINFSPPLPRRVNFTRLSTGQRLLIPLGDFITHSLLQLSSPQYSCPLKSLWPLAKVETQPLSITCDRF